MHKAMILAALVLLGGAAWAGDITVQPASTQPTVAVGLICNTDMQAERFVTLRAGGSEIKKAMQSVNAEAKDPRACGVAAIAFTRDKTISNHTVNGKLLQVVRINIIAGFNGAGWQHVEGMVQYAVIEAKGESI